MHSIAVGRRYAANLGLQRQLTEPGGAALGRTDGSEPEGESGQRIADVARVPDDGGPLVGGPWRMRGGLCG